VRKATKKEMTQQASNLFRQARAASFIEPIRNAVPRGVGVGLLERAEMSAFADAVTVVTGGASGIGRALCEALAQRGARVVVADRNAAGAEEVARASTGAAGRVRSAAVDVTDADAVDQLIDETVREHGRIDFLFNNAGIAVFGEELDVSLDDWRRVIDVNLWGVVHGVRAAYPRMVRQGSGHIVNTASVAGLSPACMELSYTASKYAVVGLSRGLRTEAAGYGVRVSVVCPGFIDTAILRVTELRRPIDRERLLTLAPTPLPPERCAQIVLRGVEKNRSIIPVTGHAWLGWCLDRLSPALSERVWQAYVRRIHALPGGSR
jgi:NAD(P)-dependent dehydrogenase (short-subunit alcohol dehydrogenase family)